MRWVCAGQVTTPLPHCRFCSALASGRSIEPNRQTDAVRPLTEVRPASCTTGSGKERGDSECASVQIESLKRRRPHIVEEDRIDLVDHVGVDFQECTLILAGDQGAAGAIIHSHL